MKKNIVFVVLLIGSLGLLSLSAYLYQKGSQKTVYILTEKVFAEYKGTKEIQKKISDNEQKQKATLDSIYQVMSIEKENKAEFEKNQKIYERLYSGFTTSNQKETQQYQEEIWKQINQYLIEYGKEKGYAYVLGATGNGNVMFADESLNVTEDVILYLNKKYEGN